MTEETRKVIADYLSGCRTKDPQFDAGGYARYCNDIHGEACIAMGRDS